MYIPSQKKVKIMCMCEKERDKEKQVNGTRVGLEKMQAQADPQELK